MGQDNPPLVDLSEDQLKRDLRTKALRVDWSYEDIIRELDRRAANRQARDSRILSIVAIGIAIAALIVTALKA